MKTGGGGAKTKGKGPGGGSLLQQRGQQSLPGQFSQEEATKKKIKVNGASKKSPVLWLDKSSDRAGMLARETLPKRVFRLRKMKLVYHSCKRPLSRL